MKKQTREPGHKAPVINIEEFRNRATGVGRLIAKFEESIDTADVRVSAMDYLRLLQFEQETAGDKPEVLEIRWIEPQTEIELLPAA